MIFLSVAHSVGSGAFNKNINLQEYDCSKIMTAACAEYLKSKNIDVHVLDVGKIDTQAERKRIKKQEISTKTRFGIRNSSEFIRNSSEFIRR